MEYLFLKLLFTNLLTSEQNLKKLEAITDFDTEKSHQAHKGLMQVYRGSIVTQEEAIKQYIKLKP